MIQPVDPRITRIELLTVTTPPLIDSNRIHTDYSGLIGDFGDALDALISAVGAARCANCAVPVGYRHLASNPEERLIWRPTWLARQHAGPILRFCQACAPRIPAGPYT